MDIILVLLILLLLNSHDCSYSKDNELKLINLNCIFQEFDGDPFGCKVINLTVSSRRTSIQDIHPVKGRVSNNDVLTFYAFNPNITFIPKKIGDFFPNLQIFLITKSDLSYIEWRDFKNMKYLKELYLAENKINRVSQCAFQYLENLVRINLEGNQIVSLHERHFINLPNLEYFSANGNNITQLESDLFQNNPKLREIRFGSNQINAIQINFRQMRMLKFVDFRSNICINESFACCEHFHEFIGNITLKCKGLELCN